MHLFSIDGKQGVDGAASTCQRSRTTAVCTGMRSLVTLAVNLRVLLIVRLLYNGIANPDTRRGVARWCAQGAARCRSVHARRATWLLQQGVAWSCVHQGIYICLSLSISSDCIPVINYPRKNIQITCAESRKFGFRQGRDLLLVSSSTLLSVCRGFGKLPTWFSGSLDQRSVYLGTHGDGRRGKRKRRIVYIVASRACYINSISAPSK
ncbi:hypothetical protein ACQKWADRAFT_281313 [Trichoderma austrokoningii]